MSTPVTNSLSRATASPSLGGSVQRRLAGLDGLRAIAVLAVIVYHFVPVAAPGGYLGVDVFFVISGFLITSLLLGERARTGGVAVSRFWLRRARRLLPALTLVVLVCGAAAALIGGDVLVHLGSQVLGAATFSSNWLSIAQGVSYFDGTSPELFRNLWSLAVEEQFYLVWPVLFLLLLRVRWRWLRVAIVALLAVSSAVAMAALFTPPGDATRVYFGTDTHSFGLALGAALALAIEGRMPARWLSRTLALLGAIAAGALVALALAMPADDPFVTRGGLAIVAALTALAIAGAVTPGSWLGRGLDVPPLRWIGERSYGLYLWHWPVLVLLLAIVPLDQPWWVVPTAALAVTVAASWASYRWLELPVRERGFAGAVASVRGIGGQLVAGTVAIAAVGALVLTGAGVTRDQGKSEAQVAIEQGQAAIAKAATARALNPGPRRPTPLPSGEQIYALGDSVMLAASPWLQERFPGITIDAAVSRSMFAAPDLVRSIVDSGALRPILLIGLATNGDIELSDLQAIVDIAGPSTLVVFINGQAPRDWIPIGNATLADFSRRERSVELANWHDAIAPSLDELASDQVHPGGPLTSGIYVGAICDALQRLAELPPLLDDRDYLHVNRPA
ncbi:MAG: acyltransferase family protein [Rhodoglobus sp.]